eukprot:TRINITY_DN12017_c0_g2_i1.p2 TRINITY_DN12017_c0_g2~~TRINITY_DN12017_c0_g2_i1.p2  ORF type:complete len:253 (-),score=21.28 TRINITY_DN12017_c0_g2_i1:525-1283(-)
MQQQESSTMLCPRHMVGRVIGQNGETIRAIQLFTSACISINQRQDPAVVVITGTPNELVLASQMVDDIIRGRFKGFALLRQAASKGSDNLRQLLTYVPTKGFLPKKRDVEQHPCEIPGQQQQKSQREPQCVAEQEKVLEALSCCTSPKISEQRDRFKSCASQLFAIQYIQQQLEIKKNTLLDKLAHRDAGIRSFPPTSSYSSSFPSPSYSSIPPQGIGSCYRNVSNSNNSVYSVAHLLPQQLLDSLEEHASF